MLSHMKRIVFSRLGAGAGRSGLVNPIFADGAMLAFPAPEPRSPLRYSKLFFYGTSLAKLLKDLHPSFDLAAHPYCHLDPDIDRKIGGVVPLPMWSPAFDQGGKLGAHLDSHGVSEGDVIFFYGPFQRTLLERGRYQFVMSAPAVHVIYGYMVIDEIVRRGQNPPRRIRCMWGDGDDRVGSRLYLGENARVFRFDKRLQLTTPSAGRISAWSFPLFFCDEKISISWKRRRAPVRKGDRAEWAASPGCPGFVIEAKGQKQSRQLAEWARELISLP